MSRLRELFEACLSQLGAGCRGPALATAFRERFDAAAEEHMGELRALVASSLQHLGLAAWPGGRLGADFVEFERLDDRDAVERLTYSLVVAGRADDGGLGWLAGTLFRGGRLLGYLTAAEEDGEKALAFLRRNVGSEIQRLRDAADPVGAALFYNLKASAGHATELAPLTFGATELVLARGARLLATSAGSSAAHVVVLAERGSLASFDEAVARNEAREEGKRNLPLRGEAFEAPLVAHFVDWTRTSHPDGHAVHVGRLSNRLRESYPRPESLREVPAPKDAEGRDLLEALACSKSQLVEDGPERIRVHFSAWHAALGAAPGLSTARREKLARILVEAEHLYLDSLGDPPTNWQATLRASLGLKPQTFSDDWKALKELCPER